MPIVLDRMPGSGAWRSRVVTPPRKGVPARQYRCTQLLRAMVARDLHGNADFGNGFCSVAWKLGILLAALSTGPTVESGAGDDTCPLLGPTREAIGEALAEIDVDTSGWRVWYTVANNGREGTLRLLVELRDPEGRVRMERTLEHESGDCLAMSRVVALVVERFFVDLVRLPMPLVDWGQVEPPSRPVVRPRRIVGSAVSPDSETSVSVGVGSSSAIGSDPADRHTVWLGAGLGFGGGRSAESFVPELGLVGGYSPFHGFELGARVSTSWQRIEQSEMLAGVSYGAASRVYWLSLFGAPSWSGERWSFAVGPELVLGLDSVEAWPVSSGGSHLRVLPGAGLSALARYRPFRALALGLSAGADAIVTPLTVHYRTGPDDDLEAAEPSWLRYVGLATATIELF